MAYSDYGGFAYKNGERVEARSDCVLSAEGIKSTPGQWPGWTLPDARGVAPTYHVVLGDGPIFVGLYKQSSASPYRLGEPLNAFEHAVDLPSEAISEYESDGVLRRYIDDDYFRDRDAAYTLQIDGHTIEVRPTIEDNYYIYVRLTQPDGAVWTGFSGYGVGAGLEDSGYGYSTTERERRLFALFPQP